MSEKKPRTGVENESSQPKLEQFKALLERLAQERLSLALKGLLVIAFLTGGYAALRRFF